MALPPPTDERLIDYLLGESPGEPARSESVRSESVLGDQLSDAEIECWLAADEAHARRLELLASSVLALALPAANELSARDAVFADSLPSPQAVHPSPAAAGTSRPLGARTVVVGLLAMAAALALAILWTRPLAPEELTQRVAVAWAESALSMSPGPTVEGDGDEEWLADWDALPADEWFTSDVSESFAAGNDVPPQWLITAVAQMSPASDVESTEVEVIR